MAYRFFGNEAAGGRGTPERALLTRQEEDLLAALKAGMTEKEAAIRLGMTPHAVHAHTKAVYRHYGVSSRGQLLKVWNKGGSGTEGKG